MKTEHLEILIARNVDRPLKAAGVSQRQPSTHCLSHWLIRAKLPDEWHVVQTSVKELVRRKEPSTITVVEESAGESLPQIASSLAAAQRMSAEAGFVVFHCVLKPGVPPLMELLKPFPEPTKVEFANDAEIASTMDEVMAKCLTQMQQQEMDTARPSRLDSVRRILEATQDLRASNGKLSAREVATVFGFSMRELAQLLDRTPQAVAKTPDADSLQDRLGYFERIARLRLALKDADTFRKWLRMRNPSLGSRTPCEFLQEKKWQALADFVDDILTGAPD